MITGKQLVRVTKKITDALVLVGGEPTAKLLEIEEKQIEAEEKVRWISFPAGGSMGTYSPQPITISADQATFGRIEYPVTSISIMNPSGYIGEPVLSRCPHCGAPYYGGEKCDSCQRKLN